MQLQATLLGLLLGIGLLCLVQELFWPQAPNRGRGFALIEKLQQLLQAAGFPRAKVWQLVPVTLMFCLCSAFLAMMFLPIQGVILVAFLTGGSLPFLVLRARSRKRFELARVVWPDLLDQLIAGLRSGLSLAEGIGSLGGSSANIETNAVAKHFQDFSEYYERSHSFERALARLKISLADPVADRVLEGIRMVRELGGNELVPMLQLLNESLRKENRLRGELVARQSWLMNAARMGALAPWLVLIILGSRPETAQIYNSAGGTLIIVCGLMLTIIAYALMTRIARIPEELRWLG
ncbi:MAG: type II secretion system F family protein [Microbacteriaceae bacterium]